MPEACIILDNSKVHKIEEVRRITRDFGYSFKFLSPYSYMLNPIENSFSKIKNSIRSRLRLKNYQGTLAELISEEIAKITDSDCNGFFRYILKKITNCAAEIPYKHQ